MITHTLLWIAAGGLILITLPGTIELFLLTFGAIFSRIKSVGQIQHKNAKSNTIPKK